LTIALEHGFEEHAARGYANLAIYAVGDRQFARAEGYLRDGLAYCGEHDLGPWEMFLLWVRARARLDLGNWDRASEDAATVLSITWMPVTNRIPALLVLGKVRARRGDPGTGALLDEARDLTMASGDLLRIEQLAAARAEWRWLQGDRAGCLAEAAIGYHPGSQTSAGWYQGEVAIWLWRSGGLTDAPAGIPAAYALQIAGDWCGAAAEWERLGCPFERALALIDGDEAALRTALELFEQLGAAPAAAIARRRLRSTGVRGLPRGSRPTTQSNPFGLTTRQLDVLRLLAVGLRNNEIADQISTTPKTVENHVSAVLAKLNAHTRSEAARIAFEHHIVSDADSRPQSNSGV
ncbi:MAG TPA: response regulator transcription factor, partial [Thermomicrobiaceae bacterium]|nr:response regulator transcription factor [Thermomicrobiaceae bacterium]